MASKLVLPLIRPILPYLPLLPTPLLTLPPALILHISSHPFPSPLTFLTAPHTHPLHVPICFTLIFIPLCYALGLLSGNVSWVDRAWPFFTPICSALLLQWVWSNPEGAVYGHNLPRVGLMVGLQLLWSIRLLSHALKRDFYNLRSEDYRYTAFRKLVPGPVFAVVHLFVVAIAQPLLLLALSLPVHAALSLPPSELASTPGLDVPFGTVKRVLPSRFASSAQDSTPVLNLADLIVSFMAIGCLFVEWKTDRDMHKYQSSKHALLDRSTSDSSIKLIHPTPSGSQRKDHLPQPAAYPASHHPGFPTSAQWKWSRHPNFAAEQLFWVTQALVVVGGATSSGITRRGWSAGSVFGPCFALSILFCASTFLTEWITSRRFPTYRSYRRLVGQFLPQETAWLWLWAKISGTRGEALKEVYGLPEGNVNEDAR